MADDSVNAGHDPSLRVPIGRELIVINNRYETLSIANDVLIAVFFTAVSILCFFDATQTAGTWLFLLGSLEFLARPAIRLRRRIHLQRLGVRTGTAGSDYDY